MEWKIRPGVWFTLPLWERAAMAAAIAGKDLINAAIRAASKDK